MGAVAGAYSGAVDEGWDAGPVTVTVLDREEIPIGDYRIKRKWAVAYNNGDITQNEYAQRVASTLNVYE